MIYSHIGFYIPMVYESKTHAIGFMFGVSVELECVHHMELVLVLSVHHIYPIVTPQGNRLNMFSHI